MNKNIEYIEIYRQHLGELSWPLEKDIAVHATSPFDYMEQTIKTIRLFDWFAMDEDDRVNFYDMFGDIEEDHVLEEFIQINAEERETMAPELKDGVIPFGYIANDHAVDAHWHPEGLLMLDVRDAPVIIPFLADVRSRLRPLWPTSVSA